ncbi:hypothetical protein FOXYSP1_05235 [Fusarium oxysporum f. sp. phaseoli]
MAGRAVWDQGRLPSENPDWRRSPNQNSLKYTLHISNGCQGRIWVTAAEPIFDTEDFRLQTRIENPMLASSFGEENLILVARYLLILVEMVDHACICYRTHIMIS